MVFALMGLTMTARGAAAQAASALDDVGAKLTADEIRHGIVTPAEMAAKAHAVRKPAMKAFPNLSHEDLDALLAYCPLLR